MSQKTPSSLLDRYQLFIAGGALAAHVTHLEVGFRQREVKFFAELFSNWLEVTLPSTVLELQNTQVKRYLDGLVGEGLVKRRRQGGPPVYQLTRGGVIELISRLRRTNEWPHPAHFLFVYYFFRSYGPRLLELLEGGPKPLPPLFRQEIIHLLDPEELRREQIQALQQKLENIREREQDAEKSSQMAIRELKKGVSRPELFEQLERKHSYQLNSQVPLSELLKSLAPTHAIWEMTEGSKQHSALIWAPLARMIKEYLDLIEGLE